jgi:hypothetical protein
MGIKIQGNGDVVAEVTSASATDEQPRALRVALPLVAEQSGHVVIVSEQDGGTVTGSRRMKELEGSEDYRLRVGIDTPMLHEFFPGAALNSAIWTAPVTTMTVTVTGGLLTLNAGLSTALNAVARVSSYRSFPAIATCELYGEIVAQLSQLPVTNNVTEWGLGIASGTTAPTDGAVFRLLANGEFRCVVINNSVEVQSAALDFATLVGAATSRHFLVAIGDDRVKFWIDDTLVAIVERPTAAGSMVASGQLPVLLRTYNTAATAAAQQLRVGLVSVQLGDLAPCKPMSHVSAGAGWMAYQGQTGGTMGTSASYANSADPTAAAGLSNTTAAVGSGLGGQFRFNAAGTAVTDGIVSSFQVPAGTAALPGKTLYITGIKISSVNLGAAVATTATVLAWSLAFGHTAVSLATTEAATTKAARRVALGFQSWPIGAAIGAMPDRGDIYMPFGSPVAVQPGEFVQTVAKFVLGTATASQVIWVHVTIDGYYE